ncbi:Cold shock domain family protein [hydrothermal vent metagenome]|uniref:Cold shock domain family protein n=1 Tax=hydrothermal vent metagenome TaxID=652676 RepID=A0A1W1BUW2_9ZZZZ
MNFFKQRYKYIVFLWIAVFAGTFFKSNINTKSHEEAIHVESAKDFEKFFQEQDDFIEKHTVNFIHASAKYTPSSKKIYYCDGREYCSNMTSCEEAKYFLKHCPHSKMDGDGDGVPCESQWCGH